jgi:hypothetical protein
MCQLLIHCYKLLFICIWNNAWKDRENRTTDGRQGTLTNVFLYNLAVHLYFMPWTLAGICNRLEIGCSQLLYCTALELAWHAPIFSPSCYCDTLTQVVLYHAHVWSAHPHRFWTVWISFAWAARYAGLSAQVLSTSIKTEASDASSEELAVLAGISISKAVTLTVPLMCERCCFGSDLRGKKTPNLTNLPAASMKPL